MNNCEADELQIPYLATFSKAAEFGSFTKAAKTLRLSQAAVSQRIQAIEKFLKTSLFKRQAGRVLLTEAGRRLYEYAQRILDLHREASRMVAGLDTPIAGELFLAASSIPGEHLLPILLSAFRKRHPHIHVHATVGDSMVVTAQVERGEVSLGLVGRKVVKPHLDFRFLASDRMVLIVPPGHPFAKRKQVTVRQLRRYPLIVREVGSGLRHCFERALEKSGFGLVDMQVAVELGSNEAIKEAVVHGDGIAVLSALAVRKELDAGRLCAVGVSDLRCERDLFIVRDERRVLPVAARLFLDYLEAHPIADTAP